MSSMAEVSGSEELKTGTSSRNEYASMDNEGNLEGGGLQPKEAQQEAADSGSMKAQWLKVGSILQTPIDMFTEMVAKPVINHERFENMEKDLSDYAAPFQQIGEAVQPAIDVLIAETCSAAEATGNGISYFGRRMSDSIMSKVNADYEERPPVEMQRSSLTGASPTSTGYLANQMPNDVSAWKKENAVEAETEAEAEAQAQQPAEEPAAEQSAEKEEAEENYEKVE